MMREDTLSPEQRAKLRQMLAKATMDDAEDDIKQKRYCRMISDRTEVIATVLAVITSVLSFAASAYKNNNTLLSFIAGLMGATEVAISSFSYYGARYDVSQRNIMRIHQ